MNASVGCACAEPDHACRLVVLTGGPGAGKTAVLEVVRRAFCNHISVLPESASLLYGGGFPRRSSEPARRATQQAIFHVQRSLETIVIEDGHAAVALCDRGTLDGFAYWPGGISDACDALSVKRETELARYAAVIHLRTPGQERGYDHSNPVRTESAAEAQVLDERILSAWEGHPRRVIIESQDDFLEKLSRAVGAIRDEVPACCRKHRIAALREPSVDGGCRMPSSSCDSDEATSAR